MQPLANTRHLFKGNRTWRASPDLPLLSVSSLGLALADLNHDGKLGPNELPATLFDKLDADQDGFVSEAELTALWKK